jgi:hypothetical protein
MEHKLQDDALKRGSDEGSTPSSIPTQQELCFHLKKWPRIERLESSTMTPRRKATSTDAAS